MRAEEVLALDVGVSEAEGGGGCIEGDVDAETEDKVLVLERTLGMVLETLHRKKNDGLERRAIKGKALRNRDMLHLTKYVTDNGYPLQIYLQGPLNYSEPKQKIQS